MFDRPWNGGRLRPDRVFRRYDRTDRGVLPLSDVDPDYAGGVFDRRGIAQTSMAFVASRDLARGAVRARSREIDRTSNGSKASLQPMRERLCCLRIDGPLLPFLFVEC